MKMLEKFDSVKAASGQVSLSLFKKAVKEVNCTDESRKIAKKFLIDGFGQTHLAKANGLSRQRVHSICGAYLKSINSLIERGIFK